MAIVFVPDSFIDNHNYYKVYDNVKSIIAWFTLLINLGITFYLWSMFKNSRYEISKGVLSFLHLGITSWSINLSNVVGVKRKRYAGPVQALNYDNTLWLELSEPVRYRVGATLKAINISVEDEELFLGTLKKYNSRVVINL
jgi:hypothetical protein|tara:strand:- start:1262 stop:1684 length:423 start_codon:yes stop_codon:yes gene_type:complete